jgi:hypothetical protein
MNAQQDYCTIRLYKKIIGIFEHFIDNILKRLLIHWAQLCIFQNLEIRLHALRTSRATLNVIVLNWSTNQCLFRFGCSVAPTRQALDQWERMSGAP